METKTIALLGLGLCSVSFAGGLVSAAEMLGSPPELQALENCATWNRAQLKITSGFGNARLGFQVERNGTTISVSCTRKPETDVYGQPYP